LRDNGYPDSGIISQRSLKTGCQFAQPLAFDGSLPAALRRLVPGVDMEVIAFGSDRVLGLSEKRNRIASSGMSSKLFTCSLSRFLTFADARVVGFSALSASVENLGERAEKPLEYLP
jgi:hypothetical protein